MKIVGFGDYLIHFSPVGDERFIQTDLMQMSFTGAEANVCAALSYWGVDTEFVTCLPNHFLAQKGIAFLKGLGVETSNIARQDKRMGTYYLENGRSLRPSYVIYDRNDSAFTKSVYSDYNWDTILKDADILYLSGITPSLSENLCECSLDVMKEAQKRGLKVFFDLNYRPSLCSCEEFEKILSKLVPYITHLIGNEEHLMTLGVSSDYTDDKPYERLWDLTSKIKENTKIDNIAVTVRRTISSSESIIYAGYMNVNEFAVSPQRHINVIDRVGSGDAFSAGLLYGFINGYTTCECVNYATASSAFKHTVTKDINFASADEIKSVVYSQSRDVRRQK